uniref:Uncharacterized protein n=1 Tax=Meleagris gallopavo TaxID=9103 RepID=A0A803Y300_MELGA
WQCFERTPKPSGGSGDTPLPIWLAPIAAAPGGEVWGASPCTLSPHQQLHNEPAVLLHELPPLLGLRKHREAQNLIERGSLNENRVKTDCFLGEILTCTDFSSWEGALWAPRWVSLASGVVEHPMGLMPRFLFFSGS